MAIFEKKRSALVCRLNGETLSVIPWGENNVRNISSLMILPPNAKPGEL
jgi:Mg2+/citrate symporter